MLLTLRSFSIHALLVFGLAATASAQASTLAGHYKIEGRSDVDIYVVPVPFTPFFIGAVHVDGQRIDGETFVASPDGNGGFVTENRRGNTGELKQKDNGDVEAEITSGPNDGKKSTWLRQ